MKQNKVFFSRVLLNAAEVFWVSAWAKNKIRGLLDLDINALSDVGILLPNVCIINTDEKKYDGKLKKRYVTAISFQQYKRKGIIELILAISLLKRQGVTILLDVYGGGDDDAYNMIQQEISKQGLDTQIILCGQVSQKELLCKISYAKAFVMPSINETFGMAYIEALSVACPIIYMSDTGIDGYFDDYNVGFRLHSQSPCQIAKAIQFVEKNSELLNIEISKLLGASYLDSFVGENVSRSYLAAVKRVVKC